MPRKGKLSQNALKILFLEPEELWRSYMGSEDFGKHQVQVAASVAEATEMMASGLFNAAVVRLGLGEVARDEISLIAKWRRAGEEIRIITVGQKAWTVPVKKAGADILLPSTATVSEILGWVEHFCVLGLGPAPKKNVATGYVRRSKVRVFGATLFPDLRLRFDRGKTIHVTGKEGMLLAFFHDNRGRTALRTEALKKVWQSQAGVRGPSLDAYVMRLRKLYRENGLNFDRWIEVRPGVGWRVQLKYEKSAYSNS